jgi:hypothetical protein
MSLLEFIPVLPLSPLPPLVSVRRSTRTVTAVSCCESVAPPPPVNPPWQLCLVSLFQTAPSRVQKLLARRIEVDGRRDECRRKKGETRSRLHLPLRPPPRHLASLLTIALYHTPTLAYALTESPPPNAVVFFPTHQPVSLLRDVHRGLAKNRRPGERRDGKLGRSKISKGRWIRSSALGGEDGACECVLLAERQVGRSC